MQRVASYIILNAAKVSNPFLSDKMSCRGTILADILA